MVKIFFSLFLLVSVSLSAYPVENSYSGIERIFDLKSSLFYAERNRKEIILAEREIEIAKERVNEATTYRFPKADMLFNYSKYEPVSYSLSPEKNLMLLPPNFGSTGIPRTEFGNFYFTRFSIWHTLYSGGRDKANVDMARNNLKTAENQVKVVSNRVQYEVKEAFYKLISIEEKLNTYKNIISEITELYNRSAKISSFEKIKIDNIKDEIESEYEILNNEYLQAKMDFLDTLGLELTTVFSVQGKLEPVKYSYDLNELMGLAFKYRSEPAIILIQEKMDELSLQLSIMTRRPNILIGAHYELSGEDPSYIFKDKRWNMTLNLSVPVYDGWASWSRIRQRKLQLEKNKLQRTDIEDSIRLEVKKSYINYSFWVEEVNKKENILKTYSENLNNIKTDNNILNRIEFLKLYLKAKVNYIDTLFNNIISHAKLEYAVGKTLLQN